MSDKPQRGPLATITAPITTTFRASFNVIKNLNINIGSIFGKMLTGALLPWVVAAGALSILVVDAAGANVMDEREPFVADIAPDGTLQVGGTVFTTILSNQTHTHAQLAQIQAQIAALIPPGPPGGLTPNQAQKLEAIYAAIYAD